MAVTPIPDEAGNVEYFVLIFKDITDLKQHLAQIEWQNTLLKQIAELSSHELRGPLASVLSIFQYFIEAGKAEADQLTYLKDI